MASNQGARGEQEGTPIPRADQRDEGPRVEGGRGTRRKGRQVMRASAHVVCALAIVIAGCGSKKKKVAEGSGAREPTAGSGVAPVAIGSPNDMSWDEPVPALTIAPLTGDPDA